MEKEIVIKIEEETYNRIMNGWMPLHKAVNLMENIQKGIPLPKGHGRLIDADALEKKMCDREEELGDDEALWESSAVSVALDMFAPTIIEANKESEKEND